MSHRRTTAALSVLAMFIAGACTSSRASRRVLRVDPITSRGLVLIAFDDGSIEARVASSGELRWTSVGGVSDDLGFGAQPPETVRCPIRALAGGRLLVVRPSGIDLLQDSDGARIATVRRRRAGAPPICPSTAPDGTFVDAVPAFHGSGMLVKYDSAGHEVWRHANPDIGRLGATVTIDPVTGDIVVASDTHVMAVSPSGQTNWVLPHPPP